MWKKTNNFAFRVLKITGYDENDEPIYEAIQGKNGDIIFVGNRTGAFGKEIYEAAAIGAEDVATVTVGYHPEITGSCLVCPLSYRGAYYEIIGTPDDVQLKHKLLQFKIKRYQNG